jgi:hypothetical protein
VHKRLSLGTLLRVKCVLTCYSWCLPTPRRLGGGDPAIFSSGACEKARC